MKIGILTFHNALNYGAVLQCYALKEFLVTRGHDVEIIDYRVQDIEEKRKIFSMYLIRKKKGVTGKVKMAFTELLSIRGKAKAQNSFQQFLNENFKFSNRVRTIKDIPSYYDYILFGSDQIWNPVINKGMDPVLWGQFDKGETKFVSYAASLGEVGAIGNGQWEEIKELLNNFDFISVRESSLQKQLSLLTSKDINLCLDPTLLAGRKILDKLVVKPKENKYIFLFTVQPDRHALDYAKRLAKKTGCAVIRAKTVLTPFETKDKDCIYKEGIRPGEFLGYIKHAHSVVANSFHTIALSLVFEKNFYALQSPKSGRVNSILSQINLTERIVDSKEDAIVKEDIDYKVVNHLKEGIRKASADFISKIGL